MELMDAVDTYIPEPIRSTEKPFLMSIETSCPSLVVHVVTGKVEQGVVKIGDEVEIVGLRPTTKTTVTGIEMFRKLLDEGRAVTTWARCFVAPRRKMSSADRCCASPAPSRRTPSSRPRSTS